MNLFQLQPNNTFNPIFANMANEGNLQGPKIMSFGSATDPQTGFLCPDFPGRVSGVESGISHMSPEIYMLFGAVQLFSPQHRDAIIEISKKHRVYLEDGSIDWQSVGAAHTEARRLGIVPPHFQETWDQRKLSFMSRGIVYKFMQNQDLYDMLMGTGDAQLLFTIPDNFWGTGSLQPGQVNGHNYMGHILMEFRDACRNGNGQTFDWAKLKEVPVEKEANSFTRPDEPALLVPAPLDPVLLEPANIPVPESDGETTAEETEEEEDEVAETQAALQNCAPVHHEETPAPQVENVVPVPDTPEPVPASATAVETAVEIPEKEEKKDSSVTAAMSTLLE